MSANVVNAYTRLAAIGFVLIVSPLFFVSAAVLKYGFSIGLLFDPLERFLSDPRRLAIFNLISPVVFFGGLLLAMALNLRAIARLEIRKQQGDFISTIRLTPKLLNIAIIALSALLTATLLIYAFLENFPRGR